MYFLSNICFMCLRDNTNLQPVFLNNTVQQIKYVFPEIASEPDIPSCVCSTCNRELHSYYTFKKLCMENYCRLKHFTKLLQGSVDNPKDQLSSSLQIEIVNIKEERHFHVDLLNNVLEDEHNQINQNETENIDRKEHNKFETGEDHNQYQQSPLADIERHSDNEDCFSNVISNINEIDQGETNSNGDSNHEDENRDENSEDVSIGDYTRSATENSNAEILICTPDLNQTINAESGMKSFEFKCKICNKNFTTKTGLSIHINIHKRMKDFQCSICDKLFTLKGNLKVHMQSHLGIKRYECSHCRKLYTSNSCLKKHLKIHEGVKSFECSFCSKKFTRKDQLHVHMKIHDGIKDYHCSMCDKKFSHRSNMNAHEKIHFGVKDFECKQCDKKFLRQFDLNRHMKVHKS